MPATRNQRAQRPVPVAVPPARRSHRARTPRASGTTTTVPSSSSPRPATAAPLAPASAITPQQLQEIVSSVTAEATRRLQTVTTSVPSVDAAHRVLLLDLLPQLRNRLLSASQSRFLLLRRLWRNLLFPTLLVRPTPQFQVRRFWRLILAMFNQRRNITLLVYL